jgi:hypothetical protein
MTHIPIEVLSALFVRNNRRLKNTNRNAAGIAADALTQRTSQRGSLENEHTVVRTTILLSDQNFYLKNDI